MSSQPADPLARHIISRHTKRPGPDAAMKKENSHAAKKENVFAIRISEKNTYVETTRQEHLRTCRRQPPATARSVPADIYENTAMAVRGTRIGEACISKRFGIKRLVAEKRAILIPWKGDSLTKSARLFLPAYATQQKRMKALGLGSPRRAPFSLMEARC